MKQHNIFGEIDEMQFNKETDKYEIIMNEKQLQFKIVLDFSQKDQQKKGFFGVQETKLSQLRTV